VDDDCKLPTDIVLIGKYPHYTTELIFDPLLAADIRHPIIKIILEKKSNEKMNGDASNWKLITQL
jgi:hypothetical protein